MGKIGLGVEGVDILLLTIFAQINLILSDIGWILSAYCHDDSSALHYGRG